LEAKPGFTYVVRDFAEGIRNEYVWIQESASGIRVAGRKPARMQRPKLKPWNEIGKNLESFGTDSALAIEYTAPMREVNHLRILVDNKIVIDTYGNDDLSRTISVAPGEYWVVIKIQNRVDYSYEKSELDVRMKKGRARRIIIKASHWGKPRVKLK
jgi:hypothetical protein